MAVILRDREYRRIIEKLIDARLKKGLTQAQVAKKIGTYQEAISRIETFETQLDILQLHKLVLLYQLDLKKVLE